MRSNHIPIQQTLFPSTLDPLWGRTVHVQAYINYRTVIDLLEKKTGNYVRMPLYELTDIQIDGFENIIPTGIVMSPALWKCKGKLNDTIEFDGVLMKNEGKYVGFRMVKHVSVHPFQTMLIPEYDETLVG